MRLLQRLEHQVHSDHVQRHSPPHSEASHLDRGSGGQLEARHHPVTVPSTMPIRHYALKLDGAGEILRARPSHGPYDGRRPDSISTAARLGSGWEAASRFRLNQGPLRFRCTEAAWRAGPDSASLMLSQGEWHILTRPEAPAARAASRLTAHWQGPGPNSDLRRA